MSEPDASRIASVAFAAQCVPEPVEVSAESVSAWARALSSFAIGKLEGVDDPWRLHVFRSDEPGPRVVTRRCRLVMDETLAILERRQKRLLATLVRDPVRPWHEREHLVQAALETPASGFMSHAGVEARRILCRVLCRLPGGMVPVPPDRRPPSRAYRKLLEAEIRMGRRIAAGEKCVDLGAAPGGWTFVALERGARVIAVDRSPLRHDLAGRGRLEFVKGDAFTYEPRKKPVDWLLADVIAFPGKTIDLVEKWVGLGWCRSFCVTVKFRGVDDYPVLERLDRMLGESASSHLVRRLDHNENEVTAAGVARIEAGPI